MGFLGYKQRNHALYTLREFDSALIFSLTMAQNDYYLPVTTGLQETFELSDKENGLLEGSTQKFYHTFMPVVYDIHGEYPYNKNHTHYYQAVLKVNEFSPSQQNLEQAFCTLAKVVGPLISSRVFKHRPALLMQQHSAFRSMKLIAI